MIESDCSRVVVPMKVLLGNFGLRWPIPYEGSQQFFVNYSLYPLRGEREGANRSFFLPKAFLATIGSNPPMCHYEKP